MMRKLLLPAAMAALLGLGGPAFAAEGVELPHQSWSFNSLFGTYDKAELQRGYEVYRNVCANCHSLRLLSYRNLEGIGLGPDQIKEIAAAVTVTDGPNDEGEMFERPGLPSDRFVSPFPNEQAARASNNGAYPVDLSLVAKARIGGPDYLYALMIGYVDPPAEFKLGDGMNYNKYFGAGGFQIAMPPPLSEGAVEYADGTPATVEQMARDVSAFLAWAAEPHLDSRHRIGIGVMLFLAVLVPCLYAVYRTVWMDVHKNH